MKHSNRSQQLNEDIIKRLNRIEGQVKGVKKMIDNQVYCDDILTQVASIKSAMNSVAKMLLENHMKTCLPSRIEAGEMEVIDEVMKTIGRLIK